MRKILLHPKGVWCAFAILFGITIFGLSNSVKTSAAQNLPQNKAECIAKQSAIKDTTKLRKWGNRGIERRVDHINKNFNNQRINDWYKKLDSVTESGNKVLAKFKASNRVEKPNYHIDKIKLERDNTLAQLQDKKRVLQNSNATVAQLAKNNCEMIWDLRAISYVGRKWRAQFYNDALSARNAIAKAYWIAANKPAGLNPAQFEQTIANVQSKIDKLVIPRTGMVSVAAFNPGDRDPSKVFKETIFNPQSEIRKKIVNNRNKVRKVANKVAQQKAQPEKNKYGYAKLPSSPNNELYYFYGARGVKAGDGGSTPSYQRYGKPVVVKTFQEVAEKFHKRFPEAKLVAGDLNAIAGHGSHKNGLDMDVYAQKHLAADMRKPYRNAKSVQRSTALGIMFLETRNVERILYNDSKVIKSVNAYAKKHNLPGRMEANNSTHEFHFHVDFRGKPGPYDNCAQAGAARNCFNR
ncbi:penicillin-insensitive murein endopeptidase [Candidatus Saccharibacteria bacterium]|nr:penicillin-insensitive murein endopeptidase [Candidatus Saccharibacteria bacterium]